MSGEPTVQVLVVSGGEPTLLQDCLEAIQASRGVRCRTTVLALRPSRTAEAVSSRCGAVWLPVEGSLAQAVERARTAGATPLLGFLEERVRVEPDFWSQLVRCLEAHPSAAAAGGWLRSAVGGEAPSRFDPLGLVEPPTGAAAEDQEVAGLAAEALLIRVTAATEPGEPLLDPVFGPRAAALDFVARCLRKRWPLWQAAGAAAELASADPALRSEKQRQRDELLLAWRHLSAADLRAFVQSWTQDASSADADPAAASRWSAGRWAISHPALLWAQRGRVPAPYCREAAHRTWERVTYAEHSRPEILALIPSEVRQVVDVGCGAGALGAALKRSRPEVEVRGIEVEPSWAKRAGRVLDAVAVARAEDGLPPGWPRPDCVIFGDVLEHLVDPWSTLRRWRDLIEPGGVIVVSLPNVTHRSVLLGLARSRWDYQDAGILDRTHLRFFTRLTAVELLEQAGLRVTRLERGMDRVPLGQRSVQTIWERIFAERGGQRLRATDPLALLLDLFSPQFQLIGVHDGSFHQP